jgi:PAS domain S-box-containing protein
MKASISTTTPDLQNIIDSISEVVIISIDEKGVINYFNKGAEKLLGYSQEEVLGKSIMTFHIENEVDKFSESFLPPDYKEIIDVYTFLSIHQSMNRPTWNLKKRNGTQVKINLHVNVLNDSFGNATGFVLSASEITGTETKEECVKSVINNLKEIIFQTDAKGMFIYLNSAWSSTTGFPVGNSLETPFIQFIHPAERNQIERFVKQILSGKKSSFSTETRIITNKETSLWMELYLQSMINENGEIEGIIGSFNDITDKKTTENNLQNTSTRLSTIIHYMQEGILAEDADRTIVLANEKLCSIFDLNISSDFLKNTSSRVIMNQLLELVEDKQNFLQNIEKLIAAAKPKLNEEILLCNGRILERDYIPVISNNKYNGHLWQYRDISKRKKQEKELLASKENAIKSVKAKDMFLSTMSHEIRTPLNAVIGMTHILLEESPKPEQIENLKTLKFSAENLMVLINDILDYNKIDAGQITFEKIDFSIRDIANGIRQSLIFKAEEKGVDFNLNIDPNVPEVLIGDPVRLAQIINNLVSNAIKFTEKGAVNVDVKNVSLEENGAEIRFEVTDTGIGIPSDKLDYIFYSFTQASFDITRKFGGTGLGLAITKRLIKLQGGDIKVESELGKGSKFHFNLIYKVGHTENLSRNLNPYGQIIFKSLKGTKLLLVEDSHINKLVATKFLSKWEVETDYAENGLEALEKVKSQNYELVLMDLQMPEMDGYEATEAIRNIEDEKYKTLPIIALTASAMLDVKEQVFSAGMNDYLTKPFNPNELYLMILKYSKNYSG